MLLILKMNQRFGLKRWNRIMNVNSTKDMIAHYLILTYKLSMAKVCLITEIGLIVAYIISAWRDHTVLVHSGNDTWRLRHSLNYHRLGVNYARFHDKRKFITSSLDRTVVIYQFDESGETYWCSNTSNH